MEDQTPEESPESNENSTLEVFRQFQELYTHELKKTDETPEGLKHKVKILESWVEDLTDQNEVLLVAVKDLEEEALKRLSNVEATMCQTTQSSTSLSCGISISKGLDKVDFLHKELEQVKQQLTVKEKLVIDYQSRMEEMQHLFQKEKNYNTHCYSIAESTKCGTENLDHSSLQKELKSTQAQLSQMEKEVTQLKKKLKEADCSIKRLRCDLVNCDKNAKEMRSVLTAEVAEKHDQVLAMRREVNQLEDQLRQADMQTHFKDDIIKELRKEVKVARSKETLVEVLGIKERSLAHLEQLTERLEQKEKLISCLQAQLQQRGDHSTVYRLKQQVDWFTENMLQRCAQPNIPEEFKKCIITMLEELRESTECSNLSPANNSEKCKESLGLVMTLQSSLDQCRKSLSQSWGSIWNIAHQVNQVDMGHSIEEWRKCNSKQQLIHQRLQEIRQSIMHILSSSNVNTEEMMCSTNSVHNSLASIREELNIHLHKRNINNWLDNMHCLVSDAVTRIQDVSKMFTTFSETQTSVSCGLQNQMKCMDALLVELDQLLPVQQRAHDRLCKQNKAQRTLVDTQLATVFHHGEAWAQYNNTWHDMNRQLLALAHCLKLDSHQQRNQCNDKRSPSPVEQRSINVKSLVTKISAKIRDSISDIEQRQCQATHLEMDLSSIRLVLESAQQEMVNIAKDCKTKDTTKMVTCLLNKLEKELTNALKKADSLVEIYGNTKKNYVKSSKRILQIQREFDSLEEELHNFHYYITQDIIEQPKTPRCEKTKTPHCEKKICSNQEEIEDFKNRCPERKEQVPCKNKNLKGQYTEMQRALVKKDAAIKNVKDNVLELKSNIKEREKLAANQEETICLLQNSLKICQNEVDELRKKIKCTEIKTEEVENRWKMKTQCLKDKICELQTTLKKTEEFSECNKEEIEVGWKNKTQCLQDKISELQTALKKADEVAKKHQRSEAALQIVISNLKERMCKDQGRLCEVLKEKKELEEQLKNATADCKSEIEKAKKRESYSSQENQFKIDELTKQAKCWSEKVINLEAELKSIQEKFCESLRNKEDTHLQLCAKEANFKKEMCEKQKEINKLTCTVNSLTEQLKDTEGELECERAKHCETEQRLISLCSAYDQLKIKAKEKDVIAEKLQMALTQLSNKFVSRRLDSKDCVRQYQEECAKFEALYNTTACKLHAKEMEFSALLQENERLKNELQQLTMCAPQEKEEESCPFLLGRVQQLTKELQVAHSCQSSYETLLKELTEKCLKKEEEVCQLKGQLNQSTLQMQNLQRLVCESQSGGSSASPPLPLQPNIQLQREISTALSSQLRGVKQRLHATRHEYKKLQANYEDLNQKYSLLQKSEKESEHPKLNKSHCTPCTSKVSKSVVHFKHPEMLKGDGSLLKGGSHSKSWHRFEGREDIEDVESKWKKRLKGYNIDVHCDPSSSSN